MTRYTILMLLLLGLGLLNAQNPEIDSLYSLLDKLEEDSHRVNVLNKLATKLKRRQPDTAFALANQSALLAESLGLKREQAIAIESKGISLSHQAKYAASLESHLESIPLFAEVGDSVSVGRAHLLIGNIYRNRGDYAMALQYQLKAMGIIERNDANPKNVASSYVNIGNIYNNLEDYERALMYQRKGLKMWHKTDYPSKLAEAYLNFGNTWYFQNIYDSTAFYYLKALHIFDSLNLNYGRGASYSNLGAIYLKKGDLEQAKAYTLKGQALYEKQGDKSILSTIYAQLGEIEYKLGNRQTGINWYEKALLFANEVGNRQTAMEVYQKLGEGYSKMGKHEEALSYFQAHDVMEDSLFNEETFQKIAKVEFKYEIQQKEHEIAHFKEDQIKRLAERNRLIALLVLMGLFLGIIIVAFRKLKKEQKTTRQLLKEKEDLLDNLKSTQMQLVHSEKMATIGQLTAGIAHEINNPINFINGNVQALQMDFEELQPLLTKVESLSTNAEKEKTIEEIIELEQKIDSRYLSEESQNLLNGISRGLERTKDIIKGLQKFSHESTGGFAPADINEGLDSTLTILHNNLKENITVHKDFGLLDPINCQIGKINQVFLNIIYNASQAIEGEGDIYISTTQKNSHVEIKIRDTGNGMNQVTQQKIFDPFFTTKPAGTGTGLGLSISNSIIEHHNGTIEVESELMRGSTFTIIIPRDLPAD